MLLQVHTGTYWAPFIAGAATSFFLFFFFKNEKLNTKNDGCDTVGGIPTGKMEQAGWISPQNPNRYGIHTC